MRSDVPQMAAASLAGSSSGPVTTAFAFRAIKFVTLVNPIAFLRRFVLSESSRCTTPVCHRLVDVRRPARAANRQFLSEIYIHDLGSFCETQRALTNTNAEPRFRLSSKSIGPRFYSAFVAAFGGCRRPLA